MYTKRIPALNKASAEGKLSIDPTMTVERMNAALPANCRWSADNYNHLFEQPTQFYAVAISLALLKADDKINVYLAWGYVGVRIVHSLVQAISNKIMLRFQVFLLSSSIVAALTARAAMVLLQ